MYTSFMFPIILLATLPLYEVYALSYWLDPACGDDVTRSMNEARAGSSRMAKRMEDDKDHEYMKWLVTNVHRAEKPDVADWVYTLYKSMSFFRSQRS